MAALSHPFLYLIRQAFDAALLRKTFLSHSLFVSSFRVEGQTQPTAAAGASKHIFHSASANSVHCLLPKEGSEFMLKPQKQLCLMQNAAVCRLHDQECQLTDMCLELAHQHVMYFFTRCECTNVSTSSTVVTCDEFHLKQTAGMKRHHAQTSQSQNTACCLQPAHNMQLQKHIGAHRTTFLQLAKRPSMQMHSTAQDAGIVIYSKAASPAWSYALHAPTHVFNCMSHCHTSLAQMPVSRQH